MSVKHFILTLALLLTSQTAMADPRLLTPSPDMSNADLRKACSGEAGRVHGQRGIRGSRMKDYSAREEQRSLRRAYRKECVQRVKAQRRTYTEAGEKRLSFATPTVSTAVCARPGAWEGSSLANGLSIAPKSTSAGWSSGGCRFNGGTQTS